MKVYAELPRKRLLQVIADLSVAAFVIVCFQVGLGVHAGIVALAAPTEQARSAGTALQENMGDAAEALSSVPVVGDELRPPFDAAARSGGDLAAAGRELGARARTLADVLGVLVAGGPIAVVGGLYLLHRLRWGRAASRVAAARGRTEGVELLALRALVTEPVARVGAVSATAATDWRRGDPEVLHRLAALHLRRHGLRPGVPG